MTALLVGGAAVAVAGLAGAGWVLTRRRVQRIASAEEAADAADRTLTGFDTIGAVVGADGSGALAVTDDGRVAVMKRHGARIAVREVTWHDVRSTPAGILVETRERRFGTVAITGVNALDIRRLAPQMTRV